MSSQGETGGCPKHDIVRGGPFITFTSRGRGVQKLVKFANNSTDRLREIQTKGGGGLKTEKFCKPNK